MNPTDYLCLSGNVIVDGARTLTYLRRGRGGGRYTVHLRPGADEPAPVGSGYSDIYGDLYDFDPATPGSFDPRDLACYCGLTSETEYVSPSVDPAPWYVAARQESADFLGWMIRDFDVRPVARRAMTQRVFGGGSLGPSTPAPRTVGVELVGIARSALGMAWGERWLADALGAAGCGTGTGDLSWVPACPDDPEDETAYRRLRGCGLVDGPTFQAIGNIAGCDAQLARFQIAAQSPFLHSHPAAVAANSVLGAAGTLSGLISAPEWSGVLSPIITLTAPAGADAGPILVTATPVPQGGMCPEAGANPCSSVTVTAIGAAGAVTLDHPVREARYADPTSKVERTAFGILSFDGPFAWVDVPPCSNVCVTVTNQGAGPVGVTITAETLEP